MKTGGSFLTRGLGTLHGFYDTNAWAKKQQEMNQKSFTQQMKLPTE